MYILYDSQPSGNGYKVALLLRHLGLAYRYIECNILAGETRTPEFLAMNPNGKIPVLITPEGHTLSESNAILVYLAEGTKYLPTERLARFEVMKWLFWEQYSHEPYIATSRFWLHTPHPEQYTQKLAERRPGGLHALQLMEAHLRNQTFLVGDAYTIADIALYAYTHVAEEGNFSLAEYPSLRAWLARVAAQPGHVTLADKAKVTQA